MACSNEDIQKHMDIGLAWKDLTIWILVQRLSFATPKIRDLVVHNTYTALMGWIRVRLFIWLLMLEFPAKYVGRIRSLSLTYVMCPVLRHTWCAETSCHVILHERQPWSISLTGIDLSDLRGMSGIVEEELEAGWLAISNSTPCHWESLFVSVPL